MYQGKMKVLFLAKQTFSSLKALDFIIENKNQLQVTFAVLRKGDKELIEKCLKANIPVGSEEELLSMYDAGKIEADYLFSFYWKLVKEPTLKIARLGNINFHPGPLPEARGSGYHAAILDDWGYWGVTVHYMDKTFDTGDIIECYRFPIDKNIVNRDLVDLTHRELYCLFCDTINKILAGERPVGRVQENGKYYSLSELEKTKIILDGETSEKIDRKIRAFWNPPYSGAQVLINGKYYTVINDTILQWIFERIS